MKPSETSQIGKPCEDSKSGEKLSFYETIEHSDRSDNSDTTVAMKNECCDNATLFVSQSNLAPHVS